MVLEFANRILTTWATICCHSNDREDIRFREDLEKHLSLLIRTQQITFWHPGKMQPGDFREQVTAFQIASADIILLLLSADFFFSDLCCAQMGFALDQFFQRQARIIPIPLRPIDWENSPVAHLETLPKNKKPIKNWRNKDQAYYDIVQSLQSIVAKLRTSPRKRANLPNEDYKLPKVAFIPGMQNYSSETLFRFLSNLQTTGLRIQGKYRLYEPASTRDEVVRHYLPLGIPGLIPVSVSIDATDCAPKNITQPSVNSLSSGGFEIFGVATETNILCEVAGNFTITY